MAYEEDRKRPLNEYDLKSTLGDDSIKLLRLINVDWRTAQQKGKNIPSAIDELDATTLKQVFVEIKSEQKRLSLINDSLQDLQSQLRAAVLGE